MKMNNILLILFGWLLLTACDSTTSGGGNNQLLTLNVWFHAGQASERKVIKQQIDRFQQQHKAIKINLTLIPESAYNAQVQAAALANDLPDVLEFDGPYLYNYVWQQHLIPLDTLLPESVKKNLLPSIIQQGTYQGQLYSIGTFDSGLGLYGNKKQLKAAGIRIPKSPKDAWSIMEFNQNLALLAAQDEDKAVLDLKLNYSGEWFTYAFSPVLQSTGADLIDRKDYLSAKGVLNHPQAVTAMKVLQRWFSKGYIDPNIDDAAFINKRVALSWCGHWEFTRYAAATGDNLVLLPLPDFGQGTKSGQGSWSWGITRNSKQPEIAMKWLLFLLQTDEVLAMATANGAVPATRKAVIASKHYQESGKMHLFAHQLIHGYTVPRPKTPAYPVITSAFQQAFHAIRDGADVKKTLDQAVMVIDQDIKDNKGYPIH